MGKNNSIFRFIPNFITSLNVLCGSLSIFMTFEGYPVIAAYLILVAAIFDFADGMAARALNAYSEMGKELDSLADLISFGFAPAAIAYNLMKSSLFIFDDISLLDELPNYVSIILLASVTLIPIFSALRLAKFNVDTRQTNSFIGLPTPAHAIFWASLPIIAIKNPMFLNSFIGKIEHVPYLLAITIIIFSLLLVSELPMFSLKFKNLKIKENLTRFVFLTLSILLIIFMGVKSIPIIIILYIVISLFLWLISKLKNNTKSN